MTVIPTRDYGNGIYAVDSGYQHAEFDAIHLIVDDGRVAIIDTGANSSVAHLLSELDRLGIARDAVDYVILTHVHLDHAGGAGQLIAALPAARLVVHPRGARHMIDPSKLMAATYDVYGRENAIQKYGELLPVPAGCVIEATHESSIRLGHRELLLLDAPGHAKHHIAIRDSRTGHLFTGDTFGLSYREFDNNGRQFIFPTTTPSQFDPAALHRTVDMIAGFRPDAVYVTHYSQVHDIPRLAADMHRLIDAQLAIAQRERDAGEARHDRICAGIRQLIHDEAAAQGWKLRGDDACAVLAGDIELNAQGMELWLDQ